MILPVVAVIAGLVLLVWSSDRFVDGAAAIAENAGVSKLMVGLTIVAFGTSAPEILVSAMASLDGAPGLAVGNALGSNIANMGLVLGITAIAVKIPVHPLSAKQDLPIYLLVCLLTLWVLHDAYLDWFDAAIMFSFLAFLIVLVVVVRSKVDDPVLLEELNEEASSHEASNSRAFFNFLLGLMLLLISSRMLVWGAVSIAEGLGVDEVIIGLTIVAIGTSLPELAATLASALKNHHDLAIGNVLGSNILNMLAVLPLPGLLGPGPLSPEVFERDFVAMALMSILMALFVFIPWRNANINRAKGVVLLSVYGAYLFLLARAAL